MPFSRITSALYRFREWQRRIPSADRKDLPIPDWSDVKERLARILLDNILPFWSRIALEAHDGDFPVFHDARGQWLSRKDKTVVTQARIVWFFSHLYRSPFGDPSHIDIARKGISHLQRQFWDEPHGGFFWRTDAGKSGNVDLRKHLYGQAFALYAVSEFALATGDADSTARAHTLFELLDERAHDPICGGYREFLLRDWQPPPKEQRGITGAHPDMKLLNTHLHLMEGFEEFVRLTGDDGARSRLIELIMIQSNAVVRKTVGACSDQHSSDWKPVPDPGLRRVSYGHDLENIWLLKRACETAEMPHGPLLDLFRTLFDYAVAYGFDRKKGGFYSDGYFFSRADRRRKIWWVQAEALVAALSMYHMTGEPAYSHYFCRVLDWIENVQVDWSVGEWHEVVLENGKVLGGKSNEWKSPYHNGRAILECLRLIDALKDA